MYTLNTALRDAITAERKAKEYSTSLGIKSTGDCGETALRECAKWKRRGVEYRLCIGEYGGEAHKWCEYKDRGKWYVDDPAQDIYGWTREECKKYVCKTELDPFYDVQV